MCILPWPFRSTSGIIVPYGFIQGKFRSPSSISRLQPEIHWIATDRDSSAENRVLSFPTFSWGSFQVHPSTIYLSRCRDPSGTTKRLEATVSTRHSDFNSECGPIRACTWRDCSRPSTSTTRPTALNVTPMHTAKPERGKSGRTVPSQQDAYLTII